MNNNFFNGFLFWQHLKKTNEAQASVLNPSSQSDPLQGLDLDDPFAEETDGDEDSII